MAEKHKNSADFVTVYRDGEGRARAFSTVPFERSIHRLGVYRWRFEGEKINKEKKRGSSYHQFGW